MLYFEIKKRKITKVYIPLILVLDAASDREVHTS